MHAPTKAPANPMADAPAISPLRDLRYRLEYLGLRILIGLVRLFPIDVAGSISAKIWRLSRPTTAGTSARLPISSAPFPTRRRKSAKGSRSACGRISGASWSRP